MNEKGIIAAILTLACQMQPQDERNPETIVRTYEAVLRELGTPKGEISVPAALQPILEEALNLKEGHH